MIYTDIDNVILDMSYAISEYSKQHGFTYNEQERKKYNEWDGTGISREFVYNMYNDTTFYDMLYPYDGAFEALSELKALDTVVGYTCIHTQNSDVIAKRFQFLNRHFLKSDLGIRNKEPKKDGTVLIEDDLEVIEKWLNANINALYYIIDKPYNRRENYTEFTPRFWDRIIRVNSITDVVSDLKERGQIYVNRAY